MARDDVSRDLQEIITIVQDSSKTNTVQELRDKLEVMKAEIPSIVLNNNRIPMLKALRVIQ